MLGKFVKNFRSRRKRKSHFYGLSRYQSSLEEVEARLADLEARDRAFLEHEKEAVRWLVSGKLRLVADLPGVHPFKEIALTLPAERAGTIIIAGSDGVDIDWNLEIENTREDLKVTTLHQDEEFYFPDPGEVVLFHWDHPINLSVFQKKLKPYILVMADIENTMEKGKARRRREIARTLLDKSKACIATTFHGDFHRPFQIFNAIKLLNLEKFLEIERLSEFKQIYYMKIKNDQGKTEIYQTIELEEFLETFMLQRDPRYITAEYPPVLNRVKSIPGSLDSKIDAVRLMVENYIDTSYYEPDKHTGARVIVLSEDEAVLKKLGCPVMTSENIHEKFFIPFVTSLRRDYERFKKYINAQRSVAMTHEMFSELLLQCDEPNFYIIKLDKSSSREIEEHNASKIRAFASRRCEIGVIMSVDVIEITD